MQVTWQVLSLVLAIAFTLLPYSSSNYVKHIKKSWKFPPWRLTNPSVSMCSRVFSKPTCNVQDPGEVTVWLSSICKLQLKVSLNWTCIFGEHLHYTVSRCHSNKAVPLILRGIPWHGWINLSEQQCSKGRTATSFRLFLSQAVAQGR